jgi:hypothetical protein
MREKARPSPATPKRNCGELDNAKDFFGSTAEPPFVSLNLDI